MRTKVVLFHACLLVGEARRRGKKREDSCGTKERETEWQTDGGTTGDISSLPENAVWPPRDIVF